MFAKFKKESTIKRNYRSDEFYHMLHYSSGVKIESITIFSRDTADSLKNVKKTKWLMK
jgi:hypothetical protein